MPMFLRSIQGLRRTRPVTAAHSAAPPLFLLCSPLSGQNVAVALAAIGAAGVCVIAGRGLVRAFQKTSPLAVPKNFTPIPGSADPHTQQLARTFYEGGFEDKMTRQEASRILGCRESSPKEKVLERYRNLMKINHPDLGGSPLLAHKVNEAKDLLTKGGDDSKK